MSREEQIKEALDLIDPPPDRRDECRRDIERALDIIAAGDRAVAVAAGITTKKQERYSAALRRLQIARAAIFIRSRVIDLLVDFDHRWLRGWSPPPRGLRGQNAVALAHDLLLIWGRRDWLAVSHKSNWNKLAVILYGEPRDLYQGLLDYRAIWAESGTDPLLQRLRDTEPTK